MNIKKTKDIFKNYLSEGENCLNDGVIYDWVNIRLDILLPILQKIERKAYAKGVKDIEIINTELIGAGNRAFCLQADKLLQGFAWKSEKELDEKKEHVELLRSKKNNLILKLKLK